VYVLHYFSNFRSNNEKLKKRSWEQTQLVRRLAATGYPVCGEEDPSANQLVVEVWDPRETAAYHFPFTTEFILSLKITSASYNRLEITQPRLRPCWKQEDIVILGDPYGHWRIRGFYRMPEGREVPYKSVLNHRLHQPFEPGEVREGLLLAASFSSGIPGGYLHGEDWPLTLILVDQFGRRHRSEIDVRVDRSATMPKISLARPEGAGLFGSKWAKKPAFRPSQSVQGSPAKAKSAATSQHHEVAGKQDLLGGWEDALQKHQR
jgi:hypothetical protein